MQDVVGGEPDQYSPPSASRVSTSRIVGVSAAIANAAYHVVRAATAAGA
jgi:hypothetical protein